MKARVLTLFGEEIIPEQINAVGKSRAVKKAKEPKEEKTKAPAEVLKEKKSSRKEKQEKKEETGILSGWAGDKQYYSIGEVAALFKVKTSNIRFWTNEFGLKLRTTRKGDRLYTPEQVREIRTIYHLVKERGYTINGAKTKLKTQKKMSTESVDLKQSLLQLRNKLQAIKNSLS
ncbi:MAG: MerR family transcriptional regulator [Bacteroidetes bacterium]|nr:MerR family transcriptional regulator [Bacteroidota bacterium]